MTEKTKQKIGYNVVGYLLVLPFLISLTIFTIYPLLMALADSFFLDYNPLKPHDWAKFGFGNYIKAFTDETFWNSIKVTLIYSAVIIPFTVIVSFFMSYALSKKHKGIKVYRALYYLPCVIPGIVSAIVYKYLYSYTDYGFFNLLFAKLGLPKSDFFESRSQAVALISYMSLSIWTLGGSMPFWIAGFKSVPQECVEAATIDGCKGFRMIWSIIIPMMGGYIFFQVLNTVIGVLQTGQGVLTISPQGGFDGKNLNFYGLDIYNQTQGIYGFNLGYASALSYLLFVVIGLLSIAMFQRNKKIYYEEDGGL